jgi:hypothetical protein
MGGFNSEGCRIPAPNAARQQARGQVSCVPTDSFIARIDGTTVTVEAGWNDVRDRDDIVHELIDCLNLPRSTILTFRRNGIDLGCGTWAHWYMPVSSPAYESVCLPSSTSAR